MHGQPHIKAKTVFAFDTPLCWYVLQDGCQSACAQLFIVLCQRVTLSGRIEDIKLHTFEVTMEVKFVWFD